MSDPLSDVLDLIGVQSSVYFQKDFFPPWGMPIQNTGFAQFHIIVRGGAVVNYNKALYQLSTGDILLFPKGASHKVCDSPEGCMISGQESTKDCDREKLENARKTRMICGHFEYDLEHKHPLITELPDIILIRSENLPETFNLIGLLNILISESNTSRLGSNVLVKKLSDALLVSILRAYFEMNKDHVGFHNGLRDPRIAKALSAIHSQNWSELGLKRLAELSGMSRSAFAQSFKQMVGYTPHEYSTRWKLLKAAVRLRQSDTRIDVIALDSDYASSTAFSRAFKEMFHVTPRAYRHNLDEDK
jgi:AraC-like DNA-binding protein